MGCRGLCDRFKEKPIPSDRYMSSKYCRSCEAWFLRQRCGVKCACCKMVLANRARNKKIQYDEKIKKWI